MANSRWTSFCLFITNLNFNLFQSCCGKYNATIFENIDGKTVSWHPANIQIGRCSGVQVRLSNLSDTSLDHLRRFFYSIIGNHSFSLHLEEEINSIGCGQQFLEKFRNTFFDFNALFILAVITYVFQVTLIFTAWKLARQLENTGLFHSKFLVKEVDW